jgi:hypothetical protein
MKPKVKTCMQALQLSTDTRSHLILFLDVALRREVLDPSIWHACGTNDIFDGGILYDLSTGYQLGPFEQLGGTVWVRFSDSSMQWEWSANKCAIYLIQSPSRLRPLILDSVQETLGSTCRTHAKCSGRTGKAVG